MDDVKRLSRREQAARTRREIIRAATEEFRARGYQGATMAAIARRAGVAVQTVYFVFHTKPALLTAAIDTAVMGDGDPTPPELTPWWREATTSADGPRAVELFMANVADINGRAAALDRVAVTAASTDPDLVDLIRHHETLRTQAFRLFVDSLADRGLLRPAIDVAQATDVLLTLTGSDVFLGFTESRGWTVQQYVSWTTDALVALILRPRSPGRRTRRPGTMPE